MTVLTRTPENPNLLHPNKFQLNFARCPNLQYFCQSVSIPGISMSEAIITNPFVDIYAPGEKAIYDLLNVTFYIDEDFQTWKEIHDWVRAMTFPKEYGEYRNLKNLNAYTKQANSKTPQYSDATITLLSSANNSNIRFKFFDVFPTSVTTFVMSATDTPENILTADATFRYSYYDIEVV